MMLPRISFGMIVLNGEPFLRYNLRALYPFAHEIIVAEGASPLAAHAATPDGHSADSTLDTLRQFKEQEDPENKLTIVTAEDEGHPNGFWPGEKDQQSQAYAKRATGDWLWQIDADEFYHQPNMQDICTVLASENPSMVFFYLRVFMYHPRIEVRGVDPEYSQCQPIARIFRWGPGYNYVSHRPPTVVDDCGHELRSLSVMTAEQTSRKGWYIWHYPFLFRAQFHAKAKYYDKLGFRGRVMSHWAVAAEHMERPRLSILWRGLSWLSFYAASLPEAVQEMWLAHQDFVPPDWLTTSRWSIVDRCFRVYLVFLKWLRLLGSKGIWSSCRESPESRAQSLSFSPAQLRMRAFLKETFLYRIAHFLGLSGYSVF